LRWRLLIQKVAHDVADGLSLDQCTIRNVKRWQIRGGSQCNEIDQPSTNLISRVGVDVQRQIAVDAGGCGKRRPLEPLDQFASSARLCAAASRVSCSPRARHLLRVEHRAQPRPAPQTFRVVYRSPVGDTITTARDGMPEKADGGRRHHHRLA
jgi:hypothetical protein